MLFEQQGTDNYSCKDAQNELPSVERDDFISPCLLSAALQQPSQSILTHLLIEP